jgi:hypothetical protein
MKQSSELKELTLRIYQAFGKGDHVFMTNLFSQEKGVLAIGTDPNEWMGDHATIARRFKMQMEMLPNSEIVDGNPQAYSDGNVGWAADRMKFRIVGAPDVPLRLTVVYHQENGEWKIVQFHMSMAVGDAEVEAFQGTLTS